MTIVARPPCSVGSYRTPSVLLLADDDTAFTGRSLDTDESIRRFCKIRLLDVYRRRVNLFPKHPAAGLGL